MNYNIHNLTNMWKIIGEAFDSYKKTEDFDLCYLKGNEWPNRIWFKSNVDQRTIQKIKKEIIPRYDGIKIPNWNNKADNLFTENGFMLLSKQIGMDFKLSDEFPSNNRLELHRNTSLNDFQLWTKLFFEAFKYNINPKILEKTYTEIEYYIAYRGNIPVGTAILYGTESVAGLHAVGIVPEFRRKGYAEEIMRKLLNKAISENYKYTSLQASEMGLGLYIKLGFEKTFQISNYTYTGNNY